MDEFLRTCAQGHEDGGNNWSRAAAERLLKVFDEVKPLQVLTRVAALYLLRHYEPHTFRDERAWRWQLVRGVRKLTSVADRVYWSDKRQRTHKIADEIPARVRERMADWLVDFSVPFAQQIIATAALVEKKMKTEALLASDVFLPLRKKLKDEHAKAERKLQLARRLLAEQSIRTPAPRATLT